jgi:hypothetical protein
MPTDSVPTWFKCLWSLLPKNAEQSRRFPHRMLPLLCFMMQVIAIILLALSVMTRCMTRLCSPEKARALVA